MMPEFLFVRAAMLVGCWRKLVWRTVLSEPYPDGGKTAPRKGKH
jgi:hypothetical protein